MAEDEFGYKYPVIEKSLCISCGKCMNVCAYQKNKDGNEPSAAYAALAGDKELEKNSASGGIFASLAESFVSDGGSVSGAVMDFSKEGVGVHHILSDSEDGIHKMQGSKYVQSDAWKCYKDIVKALKDGKKVLFCGTPCQVDAVKSVTGNPPELITIDLICHGVPPVKMLNDYFKILSKRLGGKVSGFLFRDKKCEKPYCAKFTVKNGCKSEDFFVPSYFLSFYKYFLDCSICRENCYTCPYANTKRVGDITIGDFWGLEKFHMDDIKNGTIDPKRSWSCVLGNTEKGKAFFDTYGRNITTIESKLEWVAETNNQLKAPNKKSDKRDNVLNLYKKGGYKLVEKDFIKSSGGKLRYYKRLICEIRRNRG